MDNKYSWVERAKKKDLRSSMESKVMTLSGAIEKYIRPGQAIQVGEKPAFPSGYPTALLNELIRQFYNTNPGFTFIAYGGYANTLAPMLHGNMVNKIISTFLGDPYPYPSPNPVIQKAFADGKVEFEDWTMLTLTLRLMAGALGIPFFPTKSLLGSSMAKNTANIVTITDPFENKPIALIRALHPDICLLHGWLADHQGNTVFNYPLGGNLYGAFASKNGAVVSVEKIVSTEEIMSYNASIRLPAEAVRAVVEAPFGAHPAGHNPFPHPSEGLGYLEDKEFILEARRACRNDSKFKQWIERWILNCPDQEQYLRQLGPDRLAALRGKIFSNAWQMEVMDTGLIQQPEAPTAEETMIINAARVIEKLVAEKNISYILTGVGASHLACWLAYYKLLEQGQHVALMTEAGLYNYVPLPGDPFLFANRNIPTADFFADIFHILGIMVQGNSGNCLGVLGAAQIDRSGNINSSQIPEKAQYLVGSGGANDVASGAEEVIAVARQTPARFLEQVSYTTSPGANVSTLISQFGIFRKCDRGYFKLAAYIEEPGLPEQEIVANIRSQCGWNLEVFPGLQALPRPTSWELEKIRLFDPDRFYLG